MYVACTLGDTLLGNLLTGNGVKPSNIPGQWLIWAGQGTVRTDESLVKAGHDVLMLSHRLTNFELLSKWT